MVHIITELSEIPNDKPVVIDFFATWCGPCIRIAPAFEELSKKFTTVTFLKVDVDESEEIATKFSVSSLPTFVFLKNGVEVNRIEGADLRGVIAQLELITK
jgi:thioredoxin 1